MSEPMIERYGCLWPTYLTPLEIEFNAIRKGGNWTVLGHACGMGLFYHYKRAQQLLWPEDYHNRWSDLELTEILNNTITVITGSKDSGKTHCALVRYGLTDYFAFPNNTLIIVSTTTIPALEGRVWGDMKSMWARAKERYDWLPGNVLDSKHAICTDDIDDEDNLVRDMRKGILCIPCKTSSGAVQGVAAYLGMKQERRRHLGDEFQFMSTSMMDGIANNNSGDFKGVYVGNPIGPGNPLDDISEPEGGWDGYPVPRKTTTWKNRRFLNSRTICLYGPDSPNFDFPNEPCHYRGLICDDSIKRVIAGYGMNSLQYASQCEGVRRSDVDAHRVITRSICEANHAFDDVEWDGSKPTTKIAACDVAYGGDRCVGGYIEFGRCMDGKNRILVHRPIIIPVNVRRIETGISPEIQIVEWVQNFCQLMGIPPSNFFYDSTGRGTLGAPMAKIFGEVNPIEFGGMATSRPVSVDLTILDPKTQRRRLKLCNEEYSKFVSELWWSIRKCVEADQLRGMPEEVLKELIAREWLEVGGHRIEIETKADMKKRVGYSPDFADWLATAVEGARRLGFQISSMVNDENRNTNWEWLDTLRKNAKESWKKGMLTAVN